MSKVLVLDNGAYDIKAGYASEDPQESLIYKIPNAIFRSKDRRTFIGNQLARCKDFSGLTSRRPHEKGQLVNWESEKAIWDLLFFGKESQLRVSPSDTSLILTEPPLTLPALSANMDQIVFEEYGFESYYRCTASSLVPWNNFEQLFKDKRGATSPLAECSLIIDCGYSATHIVPVVLGEVYWPAVSRIDVGGRLLTNYLKEMVSFRHYNMMDETFLMNNVKQATCFVSTSFSNDLEIANRKKTARNPLSIDYVLPDYKKSNIGYVRPLSNTVDSGLDDSQILRLTNERFLVPELLFHPNLIGLNQAGIPEAAMRSVDIMPKEIRSLLLANVVLVGGTSNLPGYKDRLIQELQMLTPQGMKLRVESPQDPVSFAWNGGCSLGSQKEMLAKVQVTREEYLEQGLRLCSNRFGRKVDETTE